MFRVILMFFLSLYTIFTISVPTVSAYGENGDECISVNYESGKLFIGDSRTCQLWNYDNKSASYVAVWGGHYTYGGERYQIDYKSRISSMKKIIKNTIKETGKCDVYVFSTINDYKGGKGYSVWADNVLKLAKKVSKYSRKYKGVKVKPTVHVVSLIPLRNGNVKSFNKYLKSKITKDDIIYEDITRCLRGNKGYQSDGIHYNNDTLGLILNQFK